MQAQRAGHADFRSYARELTERAAVRMEGEPVPRIREGAVVLNDPGQAIGYLAVLEVERAH